MTIRAPSRKANEPPLVAGQPQLLAKHLTVFQIVFVEEGEEGCEDEDETIGAEERYHV